MDTRSRKRAEAFSAAPSSSSYPSGASTRSLKRVCLSSSSAVGTITRTSSRTSRTAVSLIEPTITESSSGFRRGRRSREANQTTASDSLNLASDEGKEKEHDIRIREKDRDNRDNNNNKNSNHPERSLGLNMDTSGSDEDDNDSRGGVGILHQNLTSASSALQGLLRKLGARLDDFLPLSAMVSASLSHQIGRLKNILSGMSADGEEGRQVEALTELCEILAMGTEESLSTFKGAYSFV